jgi:conjugal transfer pilus assembly protein TraW
MRRIHKQDKRGIIFIPKLLISFLFYTTITLANDLNTSIIPNNYNLLQQQQNQNSEDLLFPYTNKTLLFISFSMPENMLKNYIEEAHSLFKSKKQKIIFVLNGVKDGDILQTQKIILNLVKDRSVSVIIDPRLFEEYDIKQVPSIVKINGSKDIYNRTTGSTSIKYALETIDEQQKTTNSNSNDNHSNKLGNTFLVQEQSILDLIQERLRTQFDVKKWQQEFVENSNKYINRPTPTILPPATEHRVYYFDPSMTLQKDYMDDKGNIFARKGQTINPLNIITLPYKMIFIDGDNQLQLNYAINKYKENPKQPPKIILANGSPMELMKQLKIRLYFDQKSTMINKFHITHLPAIVEQDNLLKTLKIEEVVLE